MRLDTTAQEARTRLMTTEQYTHGHHRSVVTAHSARRASESAAFLLPLLKPTMRLLDFGCGPGTITVDLGEVVAPGGTVLGIDSSADVIETARANAKKSGSTNVTFESRSIYESRLDSAQFDVVYAHQVLQHLSRPIDALQEAKRMLKPGGICAIREIDWSTASFFPKESLIERFLEIYFQVATRNGGKADAGRYLKSWFESAGFDDLEVSTSNWTFADEVGLAWWGNQWAERVLHSNIATRALEYGLTTQDELERISNAWTKWVNASGAFWTFTHVEVIGRKRA